jgi:hypothetical protein
VHARLIDKGEETEEDRLKHQQWVARYKLAEESKRLQKVCCPVRPVLFAVTSLQSHHRHLQPHYSDSASNTRLQAPTATIIGAKTTDM